MNQEQVTVIPLGQIDCTERLREVDVAAVETLAKSMQVGQQKNLLQPITVRPISGGFKLVIGAHRIEAARLLGWIDIACFVKHDLREDDAKLYEIYENLHRKELSPYDWAEFATMALRLQLKGNDQRQALPQLAALTEGAESKEFLEKMADGIGVHPETVRRAILRRTQLDHVWSKIKRTDAAEKGVLLDRLRRLKTYPMRAPHSFG
jgi:hypothetical protein